MQQYRSRAKYVGLLVPSSPASIATNRSLVYMDKVSHASNIRIKSIPNFLFQAK